MNFSKIFVFLAENKTPYPNGLDAGKVYTKAIVVSSINKQSLVKLCSTRLDDNEPYGSHLRLALRRAGFEPAQWLENQIKRCR